jgi:hypothetical protein
MSKFICSCVDDLFKSYDYNNIPIKNNLLKNHNKKDNAWIAINKTVYSIRKDDDELLNLFKDYYGKNINNIFFDNILFINLKNKIIFLEKLKNRKIGYLID